MKKYTVLKLAIVFVLVAIMLVTTLACDGSAAVLGKEVTADDTSSTVGITYMEYDNGLVLVTSYSGDAKDIIVSATAGGKPVVGIGQSFKGSKITSIVLPDTVKELDEGAFYDCTDLSSITAKGVVTIGIDAFYNTKWLENQTKDALIYFNNVLLPVQYQKKSAADFADVVLPTKTTSAQAGAFSSLSSLKTINLPDTMQLTGREFDGISTLKSFAVSLGTGQTKYWKVGNNKELLSVDGIRLYKYPEGSTEKEYIVPSTVQYIEDYACQNALFNTLTMSCAAEYVGDYAFSNCYNLKAISIANDKGFKECGEYIFSGSNNLTSFELPSILKKIGDNAFVNSYITSIQYGSTVALEEIGKNAFKNLKDFIGVGDTAVLTLPDSLKCIEDGAFIGTAVERVVCGENVEKIGSLVFYNTNLTSIVLNEGLLTIGDSAFYKTQISAIVLPNSLLKIGNACFTDSALEYIYYGTQGNQATTGSKLEVIGANAFKNTRIKTVEIPFSTSFIGSYAFADCAQLTSIKVLRSKGSEITEAGLFVFDNSSINSIQVPVESLEAYRTAYSWQDSIDKISATIEEQYSYTFIFNTFGGGAKPSITYQSISLQEKDAYYEHTAKDQTPLKLLNTTPKVFSKDIYFLEGWYKDPEHTQQVIFSEKGAVLVQQDFNEVIVSDSYSYYYIELYAKWGTYNVTFNTNGGTAVNNVSTNNPNLLLTNITTKLEGSTFDSWCYDEQLLLPVQVENHAINISIDKFDASTTTYKYSHFVQYTYYTYNINLYAKWRKQ